MAYDEQLAERIRSTLGGRPGLTERKMFGGIAFMLRGNMCCGVVGEDLMVRVGPKRHEQALARPHARPMDFSGRPMKGMAYVAPAGCRADADLAAWVEMAADYAVSLPPK